MEQITAYDPKAFRKRSATLAELKELWGRANDSVEAKRIAALRPEGIKKLRKFTLTEVCAILGIHPPALYQLSRQRPDWEGEKHGSTRLFTLEQILAMRAARGQAPRDLYKIDRAFILSIANFKGGVAKTYTTANLSQYLALRGFRVLVIDLDPQASLSTTFGLNSLATDDWHTVLPYFHGRADVEANGHAWPASFHESIQKTYWPNIDIVAANLNLYSGEFVLSLRRHNDLEFRFHRPLADALKDVEGDYDVILIDNPPALSLSTAGALFAGHGLLIPAQAEYLDYESARAFMRLGIEILEAVSNLFHDTKEFELFRVLITRYRKAQGAVAADIFRVFGDYCLPEPMVDSGAISKAMGNLSTVYEADPKAFGRSALKRALEAANDVHGLLERDLIEIFKERAATSGTQLRMAV